MQPIKKVIRASAILTSSYVAGEIIANAGGMDQLLLGIAFTKGSLTSMSIKIEFSMDGSTWYQETYEGASSSGVVSPEVFVRTYTANFAGVIAIPVMANYIKVSAIGTGTATSSLLAIDSLLGKQSA